MIQWTVIAVKNISLIATRINSVINHDLNIMCGRTCWRRTHLRSDCYLLGRATCRSLLTPTIMKPRPQVINVLSKSNISAMYVYSDSIFSENIITLWCFWIISLTVVTLAMRSSFPCGMCVKHLQMMSIWPPKYCIYKDTILNIFSYGIKGNWQENCRADFIISYMLLIHWKKKNIEKWHKHLYGMIIDKISPHIWIILLK